MGKMNSNKALITVCELGRLGDIVTSEPIFRYLKERYPDRILRWYTRPDYVELLKYCPAVDEIIPVKDAAEYLEHKRKLPENTLCYELNFRKPGVHGGNREQIQNDDTPSLLEQFSIAAGLPPMDETPIFHFKPCLPPNGLPERYAVFHCTSNGRSRQWPRCNWLSLAEMFLNAGWHIVEIGIHPLLKLDHPCYIDKTGKMDLQIVAKIIKESQILVGVESGFGHIANAVGIFSIIITGKLPGCPDYMYYCGRYRRGEGCNLVRFYDVESDLLPPAPVREVVRRYLDGRPMSYNECKIYCLTEQVKLLHSSIGYRLKRLINRPVERLCRSIVFHQIRHGRR